MASILMPRLETTPTLHHPKGTGFVVLIIDQVPPPYLRDPDALKLLITLYIERSYSLWKEPEVSRGN